MSELDSFQPMADAWRWTGQERTDKCGCHWREIAPTDDHCEPFWMGGDIICVKHMSKISERAKELQDKGVLPTNV